MNLKITIGLLSVAVAIGIVALINPFKSEEETVDKSPWFYQVAQEDIRVIEVTHLAAMSGS